MARTMLEAARTDPRDIAGRLHAGGELLIRSGMEIAQLLDAVRENGDSITANLDMHGLFLSRLLKVDAAAQALLLAYSQHKPANAAVLAAPRVVFSCFHRGGHYRFSSGPAHDATYEGAPVLRLDMPTAVLAQPPRRPAPASQSLPAVPLLCRLRIGSLEARARLVDVSLGGIATLLFKEPAPLAPGMRLERVAITHPQHDPVVVDIEVFQVMRVSTPEGAPATRAGCRLLAHSSDLETLIRLFVVDLL